MKWSVYVVISLIITHWMFMYIVGVEDTLKIMKGGPVEYPTNFIVMVIFTGLFYFVLLGSENKFVHLFVLMVDYKVY